MSKKKQIYNELRVLSNCTKGTVEQETLVVYAEKLEKFPLEKTVPVLRMLKDTETFFPSYADIRKKIVNEKDPEVVAVELTGKILEAVSEFGWTGEHKAAAAIGADGWQAVREHGGWAAICRMDYKQWDFFKGQIAKTLKYVVEDNREKQMLIGYEAPTRSIEQREGTTNGLAKPEIIPDINLKLISEKAKPEKAKILMESENDARL